ncbi:MAG: hypothetical protein HC908_00615 [Calothrix sp. SM1_7_51]|nr:hypothetical protein [Calothrix sp. SM1_7_51]
MRTFRFWLNTLFLFSRYDPPRFIEFVMTLLAIIMLVVWTLNPERPYMVLGWSLVVGSSFSILVREAIAPTQETRFNQVAALMFLIVSIYGFAYVFQDI